jgi:hypothetical protein
LIEPVDGNHPMISLEDRLIQAHFHCRKDRATHSADGIGMEDVMRLSHTMFAITGLAFGLSLAALVPASSQGVVAIHRQSVIVRHLARPAIQLNATALAPEAFPFGMLLPRLGASPGSSQPRMHETDGLSRDADDCNFGCIDNGD